MLKVFMVSNLLFTGLLFATIHLDSVEKPCACVCEIKEPEIVYGPDHDCPGCMEHGEH